MKTTIITDASEWNALVTRSYFHDMYHMHSYNMLETTGRCVLFSVSDAQGNFIALPLVIRPIEGYDYYDCTSVYGYPGPISNVAFNHVSENLIRSFREELTGFFTESNVIAAFSRLNPFAENSERCFAGMGDVVMQNKTVAIDLELTEEENWLKYRPTLRSVLNKLPRTGYTTRFAQSFDEVQEFIEIYHETMQRVNASDYYYFDTTYFKNLLEADDLDSRVFLAFQSGKIAAGALLITRNGIMQHHLAATRTEFLKDGPIKLVVHDSIAFGKEQGLKYLHLGGGLTAAEDDPLFRYKKGYSDLLFDFKTWRYIVDYSAYNEVVNDLNGIAEGNTYFPFYRKHIPAKSIINIPAIHQYTMAD